ncbi:MAG: hypothetical protein IV100_12360, partial [Myxococcales bacterium]|nr:hypothetical protein [Myxococcales bacterium]
MRHPARALALAVALHACASTEEATTPSDVAQSDVAQSDSAQSDSAQSDVPAPESDVDEDGSAADVSDVADTSDEEVVELTPAEAFAALRDAWCPAYAARFCAAAETCGCDAAPGYPEESACVASFTAQCGDQLKAYEDAVLTGQATVQLDGVEACLETIESLGASCAKLPGDTFFVDCPILVPPGGLPPLPGAGEPCAEEGRCGAGLRCAADGTCGPRVAEGGPCAIDPDCAPPLRCAEGTCAALDTSKDGDACKPAADCGDLVCTASSKRVCVAIVTGDSCQSDEDCVDVEYCQAGTCSPLPGDGAPCGNGAACASGLGCDVETTLCGPLPGDGAPCALGVMGPLLCAEGTTCRDGLCGPVPAKDEPCAMGTPACAPGLGCAFGPEGSFCREPAPEGTPCENDPTCATGLYCEFSENTCRPLLDDGMPCNDGNECGPDGA